MREVSAHSPGAGGRDGTTGLPADAARALHRLSAALAMDVPAAFSARPLRGSFVQFTRFSSARSDHRVVSLPTLDSFVLSLSLITGPAREVYHDGRQLLQPITQAGRFRLADLSIKTVIDVEMRFDNIHMQFPKSALGEAALEQGLRPTCELGLDYATSTDDLVVRNLFHCLLPAFEHPEQANRLFVDHVAVAMLAHMAATYGEATGPRPARGGLAPWQLRRATDILTARLDGGIALEDLARECGLSRSYFARAFKTTTGLPPHRWLMRRRLDRARELLLNTNRSLGDIAKVSGFADQSHLSRCFSAAFGTVPSEWRRSHRASGDTCMSG